MKSPIKFVTALVTLSLATALAVPAFADGNHQQANFPMAAAEFNQKVEGRLQTRQAKLESVITSKNIAADKANEMRARFNDRAAKVRAAAAAAEQDGTVTADEAKAVRAAGGGGGHCHAKDGQKKA
ncbi:MAG: hypothetical protein ACRELY_07665 [Polyangiaceae bacterium]